MKNNSSINKIVEIPEIQKCHALTKLCYPLNCKC